ncbi:facilitated trehalose transporter Tret1-like [Anastrepha ludens]|uniref:facilitated trehalose transporter Tret1-like n=1 Tax=Anastrepha ludens TaxID=28586 RepID=UPI0023B16C78|nr:facilitated trehalose transporter Tret1-like [Anastrepha ludens]
MHTKPEISILNKRYRMQILATLTVHIMTFAHAAGIGWLSPTLNKLQSPASPLHFPITTEEASWIGSAFGLGYIPGNIFFGLTINRFDRKFNLYILAIPLMMFWTLNYLAQSVEYLYVGRFCAGVTSAGIFLAVPLFISEISDKEIRGALTSMVMMSFSSGLLIGYIMATYLNYHLICCIIFALPIIYLFGNIFLPETPQCLLKRSCEQQAKMSFIFYKGIEINDNVEHSEQNTSIVVSEFDELKAAIEKGGLDTPVTLKDFLNKSTLFNFFTAANLCVLNQFSGSFSIMNYMANIFAESGSTLNPNVSCILMGSVQMLGAVTVIVFVERFGRRPLLLCSVVGMMASMYGFGAFVQFTAAETKAEYNWVPIVFMMLVVFNSAYGVFGCFFALVVEMHPAKIRSEALSISMLFIGVLLFITLKLFPYFLFELGIPVTMYSCATVCVVTGIYLFFFLPETKGKSMEKD